MQIGVEISSSADWVELRNNDIISLEVGYLVEKGRHEQCVCLAVLRVLVPYVGEVSRHWERLHVVVVSVFICDLHACPVCEHHEQQLRQVFAEQVLDHVLAVFQPC